ncbi:transcription factor TFIIIB component B'' homolog isoform X2 [Bufo gargarizans]|uniref:transcription factor TFIIIB component B'' homolog isoform X2 n=1 Tax=Bufo gargarizans TaxID=30331 RepID=UPI001CF11977|nr:transcription factor TFIIIB component B'' homolog isoform X2 [Bufo gargarizans]
MIRRARLSFKPNVRPSGRAAGQGSAGGGQDGGGALPAEPLPDPGKDTRAEGGTGAPVTEEPVLPPPKEESKAEPVESAATVSDETPPSKTPSAPLQRRKRISTLPNLAKPRVSNSASDVVLKVSQADVPSMPPVTPALCRSEGPEKGKVVSSQKPPVPLSPPQGQHVSLPEKRTPVPQVPQFSPYKKSVLKPQDISTAKPVEGPQKEEPSPLKERPSQKSCTNEVYEVVKPVRKTITSNLERERLRRAQKLRDLLKAELHKERKAWRVKHPIINPLEELEKSKMTMRDFIHFIPMSNPMSSSLEESPSPEKSFPVESPVSGLGGKDSVEDDLDEDEEADDSQMLAPRVKVAEDGSIILDEESLTVEVSRNKAPIVEGNDPIFERGSTTTYSCFRKTNYSKPWSNQETDMFFLAISMVGTDFSMIGQLFPHRERIEIKNKFKKEERVNGWRIDKAFREKRDFDFEFFAALLDKALEAGKKKKTRSQQPRKTNAKPRKKQKGKAAAEQSLCDEDSIISEEEGADARTAEKENNRSLDVDECSAVAEPAAVKNKRAKRKKDHAKEPDEENQESQDDDVTQMPKKKSKSKITARDTDNRPELQSVDGDGNLKEPLAEKKTRVQQNKPNYKESELDDDEDDADLDITEEFEPDDVDLPCKAGEADVSSQSVAVTCEEETSLVLFTEESDCQSGLEDLSGLLHSLSEVKDAASQPSDVSLVGEAEPMIDVPQEETSLPACKTVDSPDAGSGQVDEQDSEHKDKQKVPQGRRVRPAPNLSRASVKKVSAEEQSDTKQQTERSDDVEVGKSDEKIVQEGVLSVDPLMETDKAANLGEEPNTPLKPSVLLKGRFQRPRPNLGRAAAKRDRLTSPEEPKNMPEGEACVESASEPDDTTSNIPVKEAEPKPLLAKSNMGSSITEEVSMTLEKHDDGGFHGTSVDSNPTMAGKEESASDDKKETSKPILTKGRFQKPKPNLNKSVTRSPVTAPPEPPVQKEEKKPGATSTDHTDPNMSVDVDVSEGVAEMKSSPVEDPCDAVSAKSLVQAGKEESASDDKKETSKPILTKGRFQKPKPNLNKSVTRSPVTAPPESSVQKEEKKTGATSTNHTDPNMSVDLAVLSAGAAEMKSSTAEDLCDTASVPSLAQTGKEESASDDKTETLKPILTKGRFQKPKPNLNKSVTRSAVTAPPEPPVQKEEKKTGATSTDHTDPNMSVDLAVSSAGDVEVKSSTAEDPCDTASVTSLAQTGKEESAPDDTKETSKPILTKGRFQKPKPNLKKSVTRSAVTAPPEPPVQKEEKKTGATSTDHTDPNMSMDVAVLSDGDAEMKSTVEDTCGKAFVKSIALSEEAISDAKQGEAEALKPVRTRFPKPSPNLVRAAMRKETAATEPKTPEKGQGTTKVSEKNPELLKTEDILDPSIAGHGGKETEHGTEEKSAAIKPAQLKRGRLIRPVPNFVKQSPKTLSSSQSKTNEDVNGGAPALKDKEHVVATSSPAGKRKDSDCNVDVSPKRLCPSGTPQKPSCLPDSEVDQASLTSEPQSSGQASIVQDTATPQRSKFGRSLKKLSTAPASASPKSENSSDCPEKEKAARNVKSSTTKISKPVPGKSKGKTTLVKIRATRQEEDDDEEDADPGFEEESYDLAPDMQNQAPVFVPFSLRSPKPVPAEIEETVEELEILVDAVDLPSASLDLGETPFQHVVDPQAQPDKKGQYDGSAEAAMTLISMGSSVYKTNIKELLSPDPCRENDISSPGRRSSQEPHTGLKLLLSPSRNFPSSPSRDAGAMESSITVDTRTVEDSHSDPNLENKTETNVTRSDFGSAENLPNPINDNLTFPVEQISYPVAQQDFNSPEVGASDGLLEGHDTGEEATFILTLVEIPMNDDYAYSCDSSMAESLPAPVLISSGSSQVLTQDLNPSLETVHGSSETIGQEDKDPMFRESSGNRSAQCMDGEDHPPLQEKPLDSEQVVDLEIKATACEVDGDGKSAPELSVPEPKPEEPAEATQISATPVTERPPNWPVPKPSATVPVEMPGTSSESLNRNLPLVYANSVTTSKTTLKRPGKKPLGFLPLVCKEKQAKKANVENKKKKNLPTPKYRKKSPKVHSPQKGSPDVNVENDSEVPSSSSSSSAEMESAASQNALLSISQITDNQDTELESPYKSPDVATEEEAASVSEYFFSDIFMEVDD